MTTFQIVGAALVAAGLLTLSGCASTTDGEDEEPTASAAQAYSKPRPTWGYCVVRSQEPGAQPAAGYGDWADYGFDVRAYDVATCQTRVNDVVVDFCRNVPQGTRREIYYAIYDTPERYRYQFEGGYVPVVCGE